MLVGLHPPPRSPRPTWWRTRRTGCMSERLSTVQSLPPPTSFIGREKEIAELTELLAEPACRLLTLVGPGGIGKTRLALEVAASNKTAFDDGVVFVALQPVQSAALIPTAITEAMGLSLTGQKEPRIQLLNHLHAKHML